MRAEPGTGRLDLIAMGRAGVDLYGEQVGGRLEDVTSFAKYLGGSPANTAVGGARLGLRTALLTRVGDDHMGRFLREQLTREGVETAGVLTDRERLTALVLLGIRDPDSFPLVFYRENCADMALCTEDIDPALLTRADALLINGTHMSRPGVRAASVKAAQLVKAQGGRIILDVDYRPVLWGLTPRDRGEDRFVADAGVTAALDQMLPLCDLIVGTEEEIHILGGTTDTLAALRRIRRRSHALLVLKRGAHGCVAFPGAIPASLEEGCVGQGFPIEVFNVLGAGDAFMAGFLRGWLRGEDIATCCSWANACGALVVSRHGCAPAAPSWDELMLFLSRQDWPARLRDSPMLEQKHWSSTRTGTYDSLCVLAIDHRSQFEELAAGQADAERISRFKALALRAVEQATGDRPGVGVLIDDRYGVRVLERAGRLPYWIGRPIEEPGSRPLRFEGAASVEETLKAWPAGQAVKCLVFYHPDDPPVLRAEQDEKILRLSAACRASRHELLLEIIASGHGAIGPDTVSTVIRHIYDLGVYPDWWKLESSADIRAWSAIEAAIQERDPECRGIILLGLAAPEADLLASFTVAAACPLVKGFAVGRTIWHDVARHWFAGAIGDEEAVDRLATNFEALIAGWHEARQQATAG
ncbi:5-dehydro-2-deoxygluconokinase [Sphingomonas sp. CGMCC 1.13654]|uniref:5-dehydro-2-deoxygluconokinase n=1 Tax=Sphingomonas chungangi TaxID=2683589 RepID=A0A838L4A7_9SPHN|nr:5-dehydro-2-deoxygluconokinase [Sphingomonas chungangi]MBA2933535.1 5-dehydro-2-deoxygluconokinase [Sphingomonas chungangi]MVW54868.1 5-dehydro-2-deoxygluconokinase [Sphingomonas chungangi]